MRPVTLPTDQRTEVQIPRTPIAIYGAGGFGREVAWLVEACAMAGQTLEPVCFIDDNPSHLGKTINELPVLSLNGAYERFPGAKVVGGIGHPQTRQKLMEKASAVGFEFQTIIHPRTESSRWVSAGTGVLICAGNILTTNIMLDDHVQINLDCTIGHDVVIGQYTTLAPGVHVSGCVTFGQRVYVGTGAVIINGTAEQPLLIGDDATIGAGACVTKSVEAGATVVGVPAKPLVR